MKQATLPSSSTVVSIERNKDIAIGEHQVGAGYSPSATGGPGRPGECGSEQRSAVLPEAACHATGDSLAVPRVGAGGKGVERSVYRLILGEKCMLHVGIKELALRGSQEIFCYVR
eukprot:gene16981-35211_t